MAHRYDAFISHKSERKPWVRILAENLKRAGVRVFFDDWELVRGRSLATQLDQALKDSRKGILIVTPEIAHSGWVRDEYERMLELRKQNDDFSIIPVRVGGETAEMPFLSTVLAVDFQDAEGYGRAFHELLCALQDRGPGSETAPPPGLEVPPPELFQGRRQIAARAGTDALNLEVFDKLQRQRAVLLCAQSDQVSIREKEQLFEHSARAYGADQVLRAALPYGPDAALPDFFRTLAESCGFIGVTSATGFGHAIRKRLKPSKSPLLLLLSGFENGLLECQSRLALELRSLHEEHKNFHFLIFGGEALDGLYYTPQKGLSPLNIAELVDWPELEPGDLQAIWREGKPKQELTDTTASTVLELAGGHLRLVEYALDFLRRSPDSDAKACRDYLRQRPYVARLLLALQRLDDFQQKLQRLVTKDQIKTQVAGTFIADPFVRRLYWQNLLKRDGDGGLFRWRCGVLREAGSEHLELLT